jgi:hypothetical protein
LAVVLLDLNGDEFEVAAQVSSNVSKPSYIWSGFFKSFVFPRLLTMKTCLVLSPLLDAFVEFTLLEVRSHGVIVDQVVEPMLWSCQVSDASVGPLLAVLLVGVAGA